MKLNNSSWFSFDGTAKIFEVIFISIVTWHHWNWGKENTSNRQITLFPVHMYRWCTNNETKICPLDKDLSTELCIMRPIFPNYPINVSLKDTFMIEYMMIYFFIQRHSWDIQRSFKLSIMKGSLKLMPILDQYLQCRWVISG